MIRGSDRKGECFDSLMGICAVLRRLNPKLQQLDQLGASALRLIYFCPGIPSSTSAATRKRPIFDPIHQPARASVRFHVHNRFLGGSNAMGSISHSRCRQVGQHAAFATHANCKKAIHQELAGSIRFLATEHAHALRPLYFNPKRTFEKADSSLNIQAG
jgi:hypothetical protein